VIKLHKFKPHWGLPDPSPFCVKVETYLRMVGLPFERVEHATPFKGPKKKLPYIEDGNRVIPDSGFVLDYLKATYGDALDARLSDQERAVGHALRRMLDEGLYWAVVYSRWMEDHNWTVIKPLFFGALPPVVRDFVPAWARRRVRNTLWLQGTGRHSREEIYALGNADLAAVATQLGTKPYLFGSTPTSFDAAAYGFVANIITPPIESALKKHALSLPNLADYCARIRERYYEDGS
jgi:glutathione S-transferase